MQIEMYKENSVTFKLSDADESGAIQIFYDILDKINKEASRKGFKNMFTSEEKAFILEFTKMVNGK